MALRNTQQRWGGVAQTFHWTMALMILGMMVLGWVMVYWPMGPTKLELFAWHKSFGITVLTLAVLRLSWRLANPAPPLPMGMAAWERRAARAAHVLLYVILFAMPLSGYIINSAANFPLSVFGWFTIPNLTAENKALEETAKLVHLTLFWTLATTLTLHIGGALRHHIVLRDTVLRRMLPGHGR